MLGRDTRLFVGAVIVACVVLVGPSAPGGPLFGGPRAVSTDGDVVANRVMTWNMCNPCEEGNTDRAAEIARYAPQVVGLQEACARDVERIREYLETRHGLVYHVEYGTVLRSWSRCGGAPWRPGGYGQAILSAAPMTDRVNVEYPDGGSEDRGYMAVTTTVGGARVRVFNTHLAERRQELVRAKQTRVLAAAVARYDRTVLLGDFNAVPDAPELDRVWALATDTDPQCRPALYGACRTTADWNTKFDYVFLRGITSRGHQVKPSVYSDHHLVYAELDPIRASPGP
ncbi:endonuclease/exonuclease/phosphatase family protein [Streptomyces sp. NPDC005017]|uniref:endonuclease/exonuclease/phosphatase family protein n=1 Tax=Streptomyces sp. NPDC005017 TaxID=3364706 RepID=UPI00367F6653